jgi:RNA polymerase-binding protein DksA
MNEYETVREHLLDMLQELDERLASITDDVRHTNEPIEKNFAEQATQVENDQVMDFLGNAARDEISQIKQAIASIDKGSYGLCQVCGESIQKQRLQALPFTTLCMTCASQSVH